MAISVDIPKDVFEFARGDNITLPCSFTTTKQDPEPIVTWSVENTAGKEVNQKLLFISPGCQVDL